MTNVDEAVSSSAVARIQRRRCRYRGAGRTRAHHGELSGRGRSTPLYSSGSTYLMGRVVLAQVPERELVALDAERVQAPVAAEAELAGASSAGGTGSAAASGSGSSPVASPSKQHRHQQQ